MRLVQYIIVMVGTLILGGCGGLVYVDSATTFTAAGRAATKSLADASNELHVAQDYAKAQVIVADQTCPIQLERIFVRQSPQRIFAQALDRMPDLLNQSQECRVLYKCDSGQACPGRCYSADENFCLVNLEGRSAATLKSLSGTQADDFLKSTAPLLEALNASEYKRAQPVSAKILESYLASLLDYFDLLEKAANYSKSEVGEDAKKLSGKVNNVSAKIADITGKQLSTADKASLTKATDAITAFGALANDISNIAAANDAAEKIKAEVVKNSEDVKKLIEALKELATGDQYLAAAYNVKAATALRERYGDAFKKSKNEYDRGIFLEKRDAVLISDPQERIDAINGLFEAMKKANDALTQLVLNPDDKDKKAIRNARFQEFKMVAKDVAGIVNLLK
ncbi:hypothetical protein GCM10027277_38650 [Pseudoduganella ginsengisoli]